MPNPLSKRIAESAGRELGLDHGDIHCLAGIIHAYTTPLAATMQKLAKHSPDCHFLRYCGEPCSCGLTAALKSVGAE